MVFEASVTWYRWVFLILNCYGLTDKRSYGGSNTTGVSTQPSANAYLRSSRRYTVLRSKGTWYMVYGVYILISSMQCNLSICCMCQLIFTACLVAVACSKHLPYFFAMNLHYLFSFFFVYFETFTVTSSNFKTLFRDNFFYFEPHYVTNSICLSDFNLSRLKNFKIVVRLL